MPCCNHDDQQNQPTAGSTAEGGPTAMGMAMAKKMMSQGGSPMEMMQKMMGQMGQGGGPPQMQQMMQMCMGMWSEMLNAIRQTTAMAALATTLGIDEESTRYVLGRLAAHGKVTLVARPRA